MRYPGAPEVIHASGNTMSDGQKRLSTRDAISRLDARIAARKATGFSRLVLPYDQKSPSIGVDDYGVLRTEVSAAWNSASTLHDRLDVFLNPSYANVLGAADLDYANLDAINLSHDAASRPDGFGELDGQYHRLRGLIAGHNMTPYDFGDSEAPIEEQWETFTRTSGMEAAIVRRTRKVADIAGKLTVGETFMYIDMRTATEVKEGLEKEAEAIRDLRRSRSLSSPDEQIMRNRLLPATIMTESKQKVIFGLSALSVTADSYLV